MRFQKALLGAFLVFSHGMCEPTRTGQQQVSPDALRRFISELGSEKFGKRQQASRELSELGWVALPALRAAAADSTNLETKRRVFRLIEIIEGREPDKQSIRKLLDQVFANSSLTDSQRVDAFYLVCLGRPPTKRERHDTQVQFAEVARCSGSTHDLFDKLLYHEGFRKDLAQVNLHVQKLHAEMRRAVENPVSTPAGGVPSFDDKALQKEIGAASEILAKSQLSNQHRVNALFVMTLYRFPIDDQYKIVADWLRRNPVADGGLGDIIWALVNSGEFVNRHRRK